MVKSDAATVEDYLAGLPEERREAIEAVRRVVLEHLPDGYEECMQFGMIGYVVPLSRYPVTYNKQALQLAALASQKRYMALYLNNVYGDPETLEWFTSAYAASGKRLDMGKSCGSSALQAAGRPAAGRDRTDDSAHERRRLPLVLRVGAQQGQARVDSSTWMDRMHRMARTPHHPEGPHPNPLPQERGPNRRMIRWRSHA